MAALTITDLFTPLSAEDIRAKMVVELLILDVPADKWRKGGVASSILTVASIILSMFSFIIATVIQGFFLPTSSGVGLKALAFYVYGVDVPEATFATGNVTLTNAGGGVYSQAVGTYSVSNPTTGAVYTNAEAFVLSATSTATVLFRASDIGSAGNSVPGAVTNQVTGLIGVTVSNPTAFVGTDSPNDAAIRLLCTNKLASLSVRGVRTVYAYAIQTATNPTTLGAVNINRWSITESSHLGTVALVVASASGVVAADDLTGIRTRIEEVARPSGVGVTVTAAVDEIYAPTITIWVSAPAGSSSVAIKAIIDTAISDFISVYPIGGVTAGDDDNLSFTGLFGEGVTGAIAAGAKDAGAKLLSVRGASDLALTDGQIAVDEVTTALIIVAPASGTIT